MTVALAAIGLVVALLCGRMLLGARHELQRARAAAARAEGEVARLHLRRALAYYLPGNPWIAQAASALQQQAEREERRGHRAEALQSWRTLRGALLSLRGAYQPFAERLPTIDARVAALTAVQADTAAGWRGAAGRARLRTRLAQPRDPRPAWVATALLGFVLWTGGTLTLLLVGLTPRLEWVPGRGRALLLVVAVGLALFCAGLALA
ncbi:MAG: hypothetical protein IPL40_05335 [Proteobacteria bacterium]|nr:hypothetical protein [Pseudomonadota bacterium]